MLQTDKSTLFFLGLVIIASVLLIGHNTLLTKESGSKTSTFTGKEDHNITLAEASDLTFNFRMQAGPNAVLGGFFGKDAVLAILAQEGAVGLRYYYGLDETGKPHIILIGVDQEGNDKTEGLLAQRSVVCPPICAQENELNSPSPENQYTATQH